MQPAVSAANQEKGRGRGKAPRPAKLDRHNGYRRHTAPPAAARGDGTGRVAQATFTGMSS